VKLFRPKKFFGQHFLQNPAVLRKIVEVADLRNGESVLEIGPGRGVLTQALLEAGAHVTVVEIDRDLVGALRTEFGERICLFEGDALGEAGKQARLFASEQGLGTYKVVANIPYQITSLLITSFLEDEPRPSRSVLMVQKEVADRIIAKPPDTSLLSVACQLSAICQKVVSVPRGSFRPMPKVDSAVVCIDFFPSQNRKRVIALAKAGFQSRRKQLHRNLSVAGYGSSEVVKAALEAMGKPSTVRAEELTIEDWRGLSEALF